MRVVFFIFLLGLFIQNISARSLVYNMDSVPYPDTLQIAEMNLDCLNEELACFTQVYSQNCEPELVTCSPETSNIDIFHNYPYEIQAFYNRYNINVCHEDDLKLLEMVKRWYKTPYRWGGRSKKGVDCQGFVAVLYDSLYNKTLPGGAGSQFAITDPISKDQLQPGDLIFFKIGSYYITHVGIYLKDNKFAHASSGGYGVIISDLNESYYKRWYYKSGRIKSNINQDEEKSEWAKNSLETKKGVIKIKYLNQ